MSNHEIIGQALAMLREPLSGYIFQQLNTIPEYKINDAWWREGILPNIRDERDYARLAPLTDYAERQDALDVSICLNLMISHWPNLFKYRLPNSARSWISEIRDVRNAWAHFSGTDFTDKETSRALDTMALLLGEIDLETQEKIQGLYRTVAYGSAQGSRASTSARVDAGAGKKSLGVMTTTPIAGLSCWRNVIEPHPDVAHAPQKRRICCRPRASRPRRRRI